MGFEKIPDTEIEYALISYDRDGRERPESGMLMTERVLDRVRRQPITNVFFFCHGWKGDLPAAKDQYNRWIKAFATSPSQERAHEVFPDFTPLFIGVHWPSQPWGDEELGSGAFAAGAGLSAEALLEAYLDRLGDRPEVRQPLQVIIDEARRNAAPDELPPRVRQAYLDLNDALGLGSDGVSAPPDADREGFDPDLSYEAANEESAAFGGDLNLGGLLGPLRQLSYWTMKKRARTTGEGGMHEFLQALQEATAARIHLMGHSFGTIVVSGMLGGPGARGPLPRSVDSLALVQGAVSLWSYAGRIPFPDAKSGYFSPILTDGKVGGAIVVTRSKHDSAVGTLYPLASRIKGSVDFAALPKFGATGAFGLQGVADGARIEMEMLPHTAAYTLEKKKVYNLDGSRFIARKEGISGAHSDIAGPEVAHAIWAAAFASPSRGPHEG